MSNIKYFLIGAPVFEVEDTPEHIDSIKALRPDREDWLVSTLEEAIKRQEALNRSWPTHIWLFIDGKAAWRIK